MPLVANGQSFKQATKIGSGSAAGFGSGALFNPYGEKDTTKAEHKEVPMEIHQWHIDELLGNTIKVNADTLQHLYQNWHKWSQSIDHCRSFLRRQSQWCVQFASMCR